METAQNAEGTTIGVFDDYARPVPELGARSGNVPPAVDQARHERLPTESAEDDCDLHCWGEQF